MNLEKTIVNISEKSKYSAGILSALSNNDRNKILKEIAIKLDENRDKIKEQNKLDIAKARSENMSSALVDRLILDDRRIDSMISGVEDILKLEDPLDILLEEVKRPNHLIIKKVSVPIGVIGIIYESRPNVTVDAACLCIKSGNAVILKGGKEAVNSNRVLVEIIRDAIKKVGFNPDFVQFIDSIDRNAVTILLKQSDNIDLIIPRGGEGLIKFTAENSLIPVLKHYKGVCHLYVDSLDELENDKKEIDFDMASNIIINAKCQRPGVCNALETLLINKDIADEFLPVIAKKLIENNVEIKGCEKSLEILKDFDIKKANKDDWYTEYLDLILSIKIVDGVDFAVEHINKYGSSHSDGIITNINENADKFLKRVDSAVCYHNASTRFTDGAEFGKGAEMGISTDKLHARGPVGIRELTTYKYLVLGTGQVR